MQSSHLWKQTISKYLTDNIKETAKNLHIQRKEAYSIGYPTSIQFTNCVCVFPDEHTSMKWNGKTTQGCKWKPSDMQLTWQKLITYKQANLFMDTHQGCVTINREGCRLIDWMWEVFLMFSLAVGNVPNSGVWLSCVARHWEKPGSIHWTKTSTGRSGLVIGEILYNSLYQISSWQINHFYIILYSAARLNKDENAGLHYIT